MPTRRLALLLALVLALAACGSDDDESPTATAAATTEASTTEASTTEAGTTTAAAGGSDCATVDAPEPKPEGGRQAPEGALAPKTYRLVFETNCGAFTVTLDLKSAPSTSASLVALARDGFFDDLGFHRVVPGFVIQGGDPTGTGTGGPGYKTVDVPASNAQYVQGVVAMAKGGLEPPGTSGSQFFVVTGADAQLPPEYAIVGKVTDGLETTLKIDALGVGDGPPSTPVVIEKVTVEEG